MCVFFFNLKCFLESEVLGVDRWLLFVCFVVLDRDFEWCFIVKFWGFRLWGFCERVLFFIFFLMVFWVWRIMFVFRDLDMMIVLLFGFLVLCNLLIMLRFIRELLGFMMSGLWLWLFRLLCLVVIVFFSCNIGGCVLGW